MYGPERFAKEIVRRLRKSLTCIRPVLLGVGLNACPLCVPPRWKVQGWDRSHRGRLGYGSLVIAGPTPASAFADRVGACRNGGLLVGL